MGESVSSRPEDGPPLRIWDVDRLAALARGLPVRKVRLSALTDLDRVGWHGQPDNYGRLTCREVADHGRRIYQADLARPILLSAEGHLLDGFHRICKAYLTGVEELPAIQFENTPEPDRLRPLPEWLARTL